jgi:uncharacterized membrane protein YfcA
MHIEFFPGIVLMAFLCELVDSSLGMGYGTSLTPILIILGYEPADIVPAILLSECITGIVAGLMHHKFGNVNFNKKSRDFKVLVLLTCLSIFGVISVPPWVIKGYVGLLVLAIGIAILLRYRKAQDFSWKRISGLGFIAAFNKGISGGGYGPVVTGGQILTGIDGRNAIGIASLAEGLTSAVGFTAYMLGGAHFPWLLAPSLVIGAVLSTPLAAFIVSWIPIKRLNLAIGSISTILGSYTLVRIFLFP